MEFLQIIWFVLIGVLFAGYAILDGFDLGVGILTPFLAKTDDEKRVLFNAIGPMWDGNEVWLLTGGGALFAAFAPVYATVFSGFYLALMLVLFALIFRAVSFEYWAHDEKRRTLWCRAVVIGSFLPSLLYGVALGNVMLGIPLDPARDFAGNFFTLLRPFPLLTGILGLLMFLIHGGVFTIMKTEGDIRTRAVGITKKLLLVFPVILLLVIALGVIQIDGIASHLVGWIFVALMFVFWFMTKNAIEKNEEGRGFFFSSLINLFNMAALIAFQFPILVRATDSNLNMTIYNSSSSKLSLTVMLIIAGIGMPIVIGYTIYVYKIFKGKVRLEE